MDEAITCKCGNQQWVIEASGVRCGRCGLWAINYSEYVELEKCWLILRMPIGKINELIKAIHEDNELPRGQRR